MRDGLEHKIERELVNGERARTVSQDGEAASPMSPHDSSGGGGTVNPFFAKNELRARAVGGNSHNNAHYYSSADANDTKI